MPLDLFSRTIIPDLLPKEKHEVIEKLKKSRNQEECLRHAYKILVSKYSGHRLKTITKFFDVFIHDAEILWSRSGFLHCTNINFIMRILLIKSGFFKDKDIRLKWSLIWYISPHQYLQIKVGDKWINIDVWAHAYGIRFGDYARGFH